MSAGQERFCQFPIGPGDILCGAPVPARRGPGRPADYCADPKHNAVNRHRVMQRRKDSRTAAVDAPLPIAERVSALVAAVDRIERLRADLAAELADAAQLAADLVDEHELADELEQIREIAVARVRQAEAGRMSAERDATAARRERDAALALRDLARTEMAEARAEAADTVSRMRADCDRQIAAVSAIADAEIDRALATRDRAETTLARPEEIRRCS